MGGAQMCADVTTVRDGTVITGRAAGTAMDFALHLIQILRGSDVAEQVRKSIVYRCKA